MRKATITASVLTLALGVSAQADTVNGIWFGAEENGMCDASNKKQRTEKQFQATSDARAWLERMEDRLEATNMEVGPLNFEYVVKPAGNVVLEAGGLTNEVVRELGEDLSQGWDVLSKAGLCTIEEIGNLDLPQTVNCTVVFGGQVVTWAPDVVGDYAVDGLNAVDSLVVSVIDKGFSDGIYSPSYRLDQMGLIGQAAAVPFKVASYTVDTASGVVKGAVRDLAVPTTSAAVDAVAMTACTPFSGVSDMLSGDIGNGLMKTTFGTVSTAAYYSYQFARTAIKGSYNVAAYATKRVFIPIQTGMNAIIKNGDKNAQMPSHFSPTEIRNN